MANLSSSSAPSNSLGLNSLVQSKNDAKFTDGLAAANKLQQASFGDLFQRRLEDTPTGNNVDNGMVNDSVTIESKGLNTTPATGGSAELKQAFQDFVGKTFFSQMIASMRSTQQESTYFNGGQAEKIFQGQLDQILTDEITKASSSQIAEPMYRLFQLQRSK
ncbi:MAG: rod-binding protein [Pirellula sp.]|jgi:hypothetical protein|nr:rod-binding protein [Pirellula sp.]